LVDLKTLEQHLWRYPGVVDHDIDATVLPCRGLDPMLDLCVIGDIHCHGNRLRQRMG